VSVRRAQLGSERATGTAPFEMKMDFSTLRRLQDDESGQAVTEYVLILAAAVIGAASLARTLLGVLDQGILKLGGQLEKDLKTGRAPLNVWRN
jgi:Flp pilus assembly pilin Flp